MDDPKPLSVDQLQRLNNCLFSPDLTMDDVQRWYDQGFSIGGTDIVFGLNQKSGGPCGVLAAIQGYLLSRLLFQADIVQIATDVRNRLPITIQPPPTVLPSSSSSGTSSSSSSSSASVPTSTPSSSLLDLQFLGKDVTAKVEEALIYALSFCIWQASVRSPTVTTPVFPPSSNTSSSSSTRTTITSNFTTSPLRLVVCTNSNTLPCTRSTPADNYTILTCTTFNELYALLRQYMNQYTSDSGVILLLYSLLLTRTVEYIQQDDMDECVPLVARFGHCTQELLNLCLTGEAVTNVFDGIKYIGGDGEDGGEERRSNEDTSSSSSHSPNIVHQGLALKGLTRQPIIGYLSQLEALRYGKVGNYYKSGVFPIWVVGSESHFSLLFSLQLVANEESPSSKIFRIFSKYDTNDNQFVPMDSLPSILNDLNLSSVVQNTAQYNVLKSTLDTTGAGIITWSEFWINIAPLIHGTKSVSGKSAANVSNTVVPKQRNAQDIANELRDTVSAIFFNLDTEGGGFLQITKVRNLFQTLCTLRKVLDLTPNETTDIIKQLIGTDTEAYAIVFMEQLINALEPFIIRQATKDNTSSSVSTVSGSDDNANNPKKRNRTEESTAGKSASVAPLDPQSIPLFDLSMFGPVQKKGNKNKKLTANGNEPNLPPSSTATNSSSSSTVPSSSSSSSSASSSSSSSMYDPPSVTRTIDLWHYNGLYDKKGKQPKLVHIIIEQIDTGLPLIETHSNTLAVQAAMGSQLGNIEEQMATAIALSSLSSSDTATASNDPVISKAIQNRNYARDSAVVESILRTKWIITKIVYDPYPPSIN